MAVHRSLNKSKYLRNLVSHLSDSCFSDVVLEQDSISGLATYFDKQSFCGLKEL